MAVTRIAQVSRFVALLALALLVAAAPASASRRFPDLVIVTIDTLRYDRLSSSGYARETSPAIDELVARGTSFTQARVVEPLTTPSLCSMLTSQYPHEHGASRNGIPLRSGLGSLPKTLADRGYRTAALVGNWTLRDRLSGLAEHFDDYHEVFTRKRWLGLFNAEATADDLTSQALGWIDDHLERDQRWPFLLWIHYVEPHAPYRFHGQHARRLGLDPAPRRELPPGDRYDTEIAFVDHAVGALVAGVEERVPSEDVIFVLVGDHGESLGEHGYWGHGRHLYDATLRVPMIVRWDGRVAAGTVDALASNLDLAPTLIGLLGLRIPETFRGHDWSAAIARDAGDDLPAAPRATFHQAHKGAVRGGGGEAARRGGLLEVGWIGPEGKEILQLKKGRRLVFDPAADPDETENRVAPSSAPTAVLEDWLEVVQRGLEAADLQPAPTLDEESLEQLRALGYID